MAIRILNPSTDAYTKTVVNDKLGSYYTISDLASKGYRKITWSNITIAKTAWDSNKKTATVSVSGVTADNAVDVAPTESTYDAYATAGIRASSQGAGTLAAAPTEDLGAATKQYVDSQITASIAASDAMVFKGTFGTDGYCYCSSDRWRCNW